MEKRKDFGQVLATVGDSFNETKACLHAMFEDVEVTLNKQTQLIIEQGKIIWLISTIDKKFSIFLEKAFDITHLTEYIMKIHWTRITQAIAHGKFPNS